MDGSARHIQPGVLSDEIRWLGRPIQILGGVAVLGFVLSALFAPNRPQSPLFLILIPLLGLLLSLLPRTRYSIFAMRARWSEALYGMIIGSSLAFAGHFFLIGAQVFPPAVALSTQLFLTATVGRHTGYAFALGYLLEAPLSRLYAEMLAPFGFIPIPQVLPLSRYLWLGLLSSVAVVETTMHIRQTLLRHSQRLAAINRVAQALAASIDPPVVIGALKGVLQDVLEADSYFLALLEEDGDTLRLELLYDQGKFYPSLRVSAHEGLAGWVIQTRRSLLLHNVLEELPRLGVKRRLVGKGKPNLSWMGAPLIAAGKLLGIVGVGSYRPFAFSKDDLALLESVAQQAALALDNAYHHAQVEAQARCDSLTGVLNHRAFLEALEGALAHHRASERPLSLIMLDIDHFKNFNDRYGHLAGDLVLQQTVVAIRQHIKQNDLVGRWGGEEFAMALLGANGPQAWQVAQRIRRTLAKLTIETPQGEHIPAPTVSQGIAVFPQEARAVYPLVDLADRRLYRAKAKGRDQIEPDEPTFWPTDPPA